MVAARAFGSLTGSALQGARGFRRRARLTRDSATGAGHQPPRGSRTRKSRIAATSPAVAGARTCIQPSCPSRTCRLCAALASLTPVNLGGVVPYRDRPRLILIRTTAGRTCSTRASAPRGCLEHALDFLCVRLSTGETRRRSDTAQVGLHADQHVRSCALDRCDKLTPRRHWPSADLVALASSASRVLAPSRARG